MISLICTIKYKRSAQNVTDDCLMYYGMLSYFVGKICMHQHSALSPLLFVIVMESISIEFRVALPLELLSVVDYCGRWTKGLLDHFWHAHFFQMVDFSDVPISAV